MTPSCGPRPGVRRDQIRGGDWEKPWGYLESDLKTGHDGPTRSNRFLDAADQPSVSEQPDQLPRLVFGQARRLAHQVREVESRAGGQAVDPLAGRHVVPVHIDRGGPVFLAAVDGDGADLLDAEGGLAGADEPVTELDRVVLARGRVEVAGVDAGHRVAQRRQV